MPQKKTVRLIRVLVDVDYDQVAAKWTHVLKFRHDIDKNVNVGIDGGDASKRIVLRFVLDDDENWEFKNANGKFSFTLKNGSSTTGKFDIDVPKPHVLRAQVIHPDANTNKGKHEYNLVAWNKNDPAIKAEIDPTVTCFGADVN